MILLSAPLRACRAGEQEAAKSTARLSKRYSILATCFQRVGDMSGAVRAIAHGIVRCLLAFYACVFLRVLVFPFTFIWYFFHIYWYFASVYWYSRLLVRYCSQYCALPDGVLLVRLLKIFGISIRFIGTSLTFIGVFIRFVVFLFRLLLFFTFLVFFILSSA